MSDFSEILYEKAEWHADRAIGQKMQMCEIQDGGRPLLKIVKSPYLSEKLSDFDEIWYTTSGARPERMMSSLGKKS